MQEVMFTVTSSIFTRSPITNVFPIAGNCENDPKWREGVVSLKYETSGLTSAGTITKETMKV